MRVSRRLQQINNMISGHYHHIWDCCCDHGLLGLALLRRQAGRTIHFVDVVEPLMLTLSDQLNCEYSHLPPESWQVHCLNVAELPLSSMDDGATERPHLIVIAGVGGDLLIDLVESIVTAHPNHSLEFVLCPVYHNYKVRQRLIDLGLGLINESLVRDKGRFYEVIHVAVDVAQPISVVGSTMWDFARVDDREYLKQTIAHYQRMVKNPELDAERIVAEYRALQLG